MKRFYIFLFAAFALLLTSCGSNEFCVQGTITETDLTTDAIIVMTDLFNQTADTTVIVDGTFSFSGPADITTMKKIALVPKSGARNYHYCTFIPEKGTITVDLDSMESMVFNGPVNKLMSEYTGKVAALRDNFYDSLDALEESIKDEAELEAKSEERYQQYQSDMAALMDENFAANKDNAIALYILTTNQKIYDFNTAAEANEYLADAPAFIKENATVAKVLKNLEASDNTKEGMPFVDFTGEDAEGGARSLSDFVGKGKYVLVDFWASWCGPCRGEIPNLVRIHKDYADKGLIVLGVPVWDERPDTDAAIVELGIKYDQIYVGADRTPTNLYGISGIPQIILFAPDGTIARRNLRGAAIEEAVKSVL